jgi:hypothetical protein
MNTPKVIVSKKPSKNATKTSPPKKNPPKRGPPKKN